MGVKSFKSWWRSGSPWIWLNAGAVTISIVSVVVLLTLITVRGLAHFWPADVVQFQYTETQNSEPRRVFGEFVSKETLTVERLRGAGIEQDTDATYATRYLVKVGNRDVYGSDFMFVLEHWMRDRGTPENLVTVERMEWGNQYGYPQAVFENGEEVASGPEVWPEIQRRIERVNGLRGQIHDIQRGGIGEVNYALEQLRLKQRRLELDGELTEQARAALRKERAQLDARFSDLQQELNTLYQAMNRDSFTIEVMDGRVTSENLSQVVRAYHPNAMGVFEKLGFYFIKLWEFISDDPREAKIGRAHV